MSASRNLFWGLVASTGLFSACTPTRSTTQQNDYKRATSLATHTAAAEDSTVYTRFNSIAAHDKITPKPFRAHNKEFAESGVTFKQNATVSTIGVNVKDSTYYLKTYNRNTSQIVTTYMGGYDKQNQDAKDLLPKATSAIQNSKIKLPERQGGPYWVNAPDSNTVIIFSYLGNKFKHKTFINLQAKTLSECTCDTSSEEAKTKYQRNADLVHVAENYRNSKKFKIDNEFHLR